MVKPIPVKMATPYKVFQLAPSGIVAKPDFVANQEKPKTPSCTIMPPRAAIAGRVILDNEERRPSITSLLTSSPTRKKKIAISPSLTHKSICF